MQQLTLDLFLPSSDVHSDLILGNCNFLAFQWIDRWPAWPTFVMALYGSEKSGKTHFAHIWQQKTKAVLWKIEEFESQSWENQLFNTSNNFCIQGAPTFEQNFLHFFNAVQQRKGCLLLTDPLPPAHWNIQLPDLRSRLNSIPTLGIEQPDEDFLNILLVKLFAQQQFKIAPEMIEFAVLRLPRTFAAIHFFADYIMQSVTPLSWNLLKEGINCVLEKMSVQEK